MMSMHSNCNTIREKFSRTTRKKKEKENGNGARKKDVRDISLPYSAIRLDSLKGDRRVVLQTCCPFDLRQLTVTVVQKLYRST